MPQPSIVLSPRGASTMGRAAAQRPRGAWQAGDALHPQPRPLFFLTFRQRTVQPVPVGTCWKCPPLPARPAAQLAPAGFSSAPCGGLQASGLLLAAAFSAASVALGWVPAENVPHPAPRRLLPGAASSRSAALSPSRRRARLPPALMPQRSSVPSHQRSQPGGWHQLSHRPFGMHPSQDHGRNRTSQTPQPSWHKLFSLKERQAPNHDCAGLRGALQAGACTFQGSAAPSALGGTRALT